MTLGDLLLENRIILLQGEIHDLAGAPFNINSTLQLREVLFNKHSGQEMLQVKPLMDEVFREWIV